MANMYELLKEPEPAKPPSRIFAERMQNGGWQYTRPSGETVYDPLKAKVDSGTNPYLIRSRDTPNSYKS